MAQENSRQMPIKGTCKANQIDHHLKPHEELVGVCIGWTPAPTESIEPQKDVAFDLYSALGTCKEYIKTFPAPIAPSLTRSAIAMADKAIKQYEESLEAK